MKIRLRREAGLPLSGDDDRRLRRAAPLPLPGAVAGRMVRRRQLHHQPAEPRDGLAQLVAVHDDVDHAVLEQIFGALKTLRQLLADGLLDDARAGEADQRAGLGEMHVAEHGVGGGDAAGRRIGEDDDVGQARVLHHVDGDGGARQLHQREDALLHARAARAGEEHVGRAAAATAASAPAMIASAAAMPSEPPMKSKSCTAATSGTPSTVPAPSMTASSSPVFAFAAFSRSRVAALVAEAQRIERHRAASGSVSHCAVVEEEPEARARVDALVIAGIRKDELVRLADPCETPSRPSPGISPRDSPPSRASLPQDADFWADDVFDPVCQRSKSSIRPPSGGRRARLAPAPPRARSPPRRSSRVARFSASRLVSTARTSAEPTTTPSALRPIAAACSGVGHAETDRDR